MIMQFNSSNTIITTEKLVHSEWNECKEDNRGNELTFVAYPAILQGRKSL